AYIGGIHRFAARLDDRYELVAGAFDVDAERGRAFALDNLIAEDRAYTDYQSMVAAEAAREDGVDIIAICTPNFTHFPIARACLE
ncbi:Gfo/Idh/MocA family oxidoreductase, partial [Klebsiella pneumoniae]